MMMTMVLIFSYLFGKSLELLFVAAARRRVTLGRELAQGRVQCQLILVAQLGWVTVRLLVAVGGAQLLHQFAACFLFVVVFVQLSNKYAEKHAPFRQIARMYDNYQCSAWRRRVAQL